MKYLLFAVSLAMASGSAVAEEGWGAGADGPPEWQEKLGITDEQREEMRRVHEAGGGRKEVRAVFTEEQMEMIRYSKSSKGRRAAKSYKNLQRKLDLSDEQTAEMEKILAERGSRDDLYAVLTPEQKETMDKEAEARRARQGKGGWPPYMQKRSSSPEPEAKAESDMVEKPAE